MPKPIYGIAGSGMHMNISLSKDGKNVLFNENDKLGLSKEAYYFMAGVLKHAKAICTVTNPTVNSYKRIASGYEAPMYIAWSAKDKSPLIRVPSKRGEETRFEMRNPDPSCNPYLALAAIFKAGLEGIKNSERIPRAVDENVNEMSDEDRMGLKIDTLPKSLEEAIECFEKDMLIKEALGEHIYSRFIEAKRLEWEEYRNRINQWEIDQYLTKF
jgi:glutamine synthetase